MNLKNWLTLTVRVVDFNLVAKQPDLLAKLRKLTLAPYSGLNHELNQMLKDVQERSVNCKILLAYRFKDLVGWAILSKEDTDFTFSETLQGFKKEDGWMFQVYVDPNQRRQGIASELYKMAQRRIGNDVICVCPWDNNSSGFYNKFPNVNRKNL